MPWWTGRRCSRISRRSSSPATATSTDRRFPVQWVIRPMSDEHHDYRGYAGQVAGGVWRAGDEVLVLPSGQRTRVASVDTRDGPIDAAIPAMSVTIRLEDDHRRAPRRHARRPGRPADCRAELAATVCWMSERPLSPGARLGDQAHDAHGAGVVDGIDGVVDMETLGERDADRDGAERHRHRAPAPLEPADGRSLRVEPRDRPFILIDEATNDTVAAGMVRSARA